LIVLDASAVLDLVLDVNPVADLLRARLLKERDWAAPYLLDAEVGQVLRRFVAKGQITARRASQALQDFMDLPLHRYPHAPLLERAFELRENVVTFYDALYLALAEALEAELLTRDQALAAVPKVQAQVTVV